MGKNMFEAIFVEGNIIYLVFLGVAIIAFHFKKVWLRYPIMLLSLATIGFLQMGCPSPVRALQTVSENFTQLHTVVTFAAKVAIVLVSALFFGKIFCGWVCPKGVIQEFLFQKKLRWNVAPTWDRWLRKLKYVILLLVIALPLFLHYKPFNSDTSPFAAMFNLGGGTIALGLLTVTLFSSLFIYRPFCRYVCPTGALLGLASYLSRIQFLTSNCTTCQRACKQCEIGALHCPTKGENNECFSVDKGECIMCGECRSNCPQSIAIKWR